MTDINLEINRQDINITANLMRATLSSPWVDVRDYPSFSAAIDAIGALEKTLLIPNQQNVTGNKTAPANVVVKVLKGGSLTSSNSSKVTFNGPFEAGLYYVFKGNLVVEFGTGSVKKVYPQWWGAKDGQESTVALQDAINAFPEVAISKGTYDFTGIAFNDYTALIGNGGKSTILQYTPATGDAITFSAEGITNPKIYGLKIFSPNSSSGKAIRGAGVVSEFAIDNYEIQGFKIGIEIEIPINIKIGQGRLIGQGKAVEGGIGLNFPSGMGTTVYSEATYISNYETGVCNHAASCEFNRPIIEGCKNPFDLNRFTTIISPYFDIETDEKIINCTIAGILLLYPNTVYNDSTVADSIPYIVFNDAYSRYSTTIIQIGVTQFFNNSRRTIGDVPPIAETWAVGDICWNTAPAAGGTPGWVCVHSGTFGAATDNTGDTDGSTAIITGMTDTSDFAVGDYVDVSAGFPTPGPYKIIAKTATSITIDTNSNSAESNITVDTSDPTFKAMANLAA